MDVNMGENDIVETSLMSHETERRKILTKMQHVDETISILKKRKIEANRRFEMLNAPKRAEMKKKQEQQKMGTNKKKKQKVIGMELSFPTDHPDVPKLIETIVQLYSILYQSTDSRSTKTVSGRSAKDEQSQRMIAEAQ